MWPLRTVQRADHALAPLLDEKSEPAAGFDTPRLDIDEPEAFERPRRPRSRWLALALGTLTILLTVATWRALAAPGLVGDTGPSARPTRHVEAEAQSKPARVRPVVTSIFQLRPSAASSPSTAPAAPLEPFPTPSSSPPLSSSEPPVDSPSIASPSSPATSSTPSATVVTSTEASSSAVIAPSTPAVPKIAIKPASAESACPEGERCKFLVIHTVGDQETRACSSQVAALTC